MKEQFSPRGVDKIQDRFSSIFKIDVISRAVKHFSLFEKIIFYTLFVVMSLSVYSLISNLNEYITETTPLNGGEITEGVIGTPRFINPILATGDADRDLTSLIYAGLTRTDPRTGQVLPDIAERYDVSEDGRTYTFYLKNSVRFHDNTELTTDDVEFTIQKIQDGAIKSPKRPNWEGVLVEKIDQHTVAFHLKQPYAPFLENTSIGIIPKHLWKNVSAEEFPFSQFNFEPIGAGPFQVEKIERNGSGLPTKYVLTGFKKYALGKPYLETINIASFPNEQELFVAFQKGYIDSMHSITPEQAMSIKDDYHEVKTYPLPRIFAVFFNQSQQIIFADKAVRQALDMAVDKDAIIKNVFNGYAAAVNSPLPLLQNSIDASETPNKTSDERIAEAQKILTDGGWTVNPDTHVFEKITTKNKKVTDTKVLQFSISTANAPELQRTAQMLKDQWTKVGAIVEVKVYESGDLNQNVIRPRKYDSLLFGEIIGRDLDLYAFWHSSQRNDPGLNIAQYTNTAADKMLEEARVESDNSTRLETYKKLAEEIRKDTPAVFLFSPQFIYVVPKEVRGVVLNSITIPSDRFDNVYKWYTETEKVWKIFSKNK